MKRKLVEMEHVTYRYEGGVTALHDVSFHIEEGEKVALLGPNGSGKSTTFLCLNGVLKPQKGRIYCDEKQISYKRQGKKELRSKVGIVFQDPDDQLFSASVVQEISFGPLNLGFSEEETKKRVQNVIETLHMEKLVERPTHFLSGGEKKRVTIADVVVMEPDVILFDEPVAALDPLHTEIVYEMIDELRNKGMTVVISTHDVNHAYAWADRILVFCEGEIIGNGTPEEIFTQESLLNRANLKQPFVLEMVKRLENRGVKGKLERYPKTMDELEQWIIGGKA